VAALLGRDRICRSHRCADDQDPTIQRSNGVRSMSCSMVRLVMRRQLCTNRANQRVDRGNPPATLVRARKGPVAALDRNGTQLVLGGVIRHAGNAYKLSALTL